ncbi:UDP-GlcNAc--UDP-phosphate GlcNAc-1-phosphate transferase [Pedobacter agri]|uniref:UDP-GlcNAc--UDP-phosphate GlcNAc-1-phosphate transferase n=1 Tax=Pedobacter agri TaxID=454586 RepID=UPI00293109FD|nr:UDP-GlcNAc--UDP-phosphate GlcNAc-1-phosphate transferase [Pedobacter agri]
MIYISIVFFTILLFGIMYLYLQTADRYNIIDAPNERSSHAEHTIRGGGIIFPIALLLEFAFSGYQYAWFITGLLFISAISFLDDLKNQDFRVRFSIHLLAVALLFYQLNLYVFPWYIVGLALLFVIGGINAINFMDGINGITGGYSLLTLLSLLYINISHFHFIDNMIIIAAIAAVLVFNFFNFRSLARCFAGDVGSVSIAFIILFFILKLIIFSNNLNYILLLLVYGLDVVSTMFFRILRKENIFEAHRTHFYQFLANERNISHLQVTVYYCLIQLGVNLCLIFLNIDKISYLALILTITGTFFVAFRLVVQGRKELVKGLHKGNN